MKVVRIITRLNLGGPLRQLQALVPGLAREGIAGPLWVGEPAAGETDHSHLLAAAGVDVVKVPGLSRPISPLADRAARRWMTERLKAEKPDVVHTHMGKAGALGRMAAHAAGVPVIVHTFHGHHMTAAFPRGVAARLVERRLARITTAGICLSASQRHDLVERFHVLPPGKAVVIGPGIDIAALRASVDPERVAAIRREHRPNEGALFLWLGRLVAVKDPLFAARVAAEHSGRIDGDDPIFRLIMAGDGALREDVLRAIGTVDGVAIPDAVNAVRLVGAVLDPWNWIAASDAVVITSRSEGTPIAAVEAMALGVCVIAADVGGVADTVGDRGFLFPHGEADRLDHLLTIMAVVDETRQEVAERVKATSDALFGAARLVKETADLYRTLLERGAATGGR